MVIGECVWFQGCLFVSLFVIWLVDQLFVARCRIVLVCIAVVTLYLGTLYRISIHGPLPPSFSSSSFSFLVLVVLVYIYIYMCVCVVVLHTYINQYCYFFFTYNEDHHDG